MILPSFQKSRLHCDQGAHSSFERSNSGSDGSRNVEGGGHSLSHGHDNSNLEVAGNFIKKKI